MREATSKPPERFVPVKIDGHGRVIDTKTNLIEDWLYRDFRDVLGPESVRWAARFNSHPELAELERWVPMTLKEAVIYHRSTKR